MSNPRAQSAGAPAPRPCTPRLLTGSRATLPRRADLRATQGAWALGRDPNVMTDAPQPCSAHPGEGIYRQTGCHGTDLQPCLDGGVEGHTGDDDGVDGKLAELRRVHHWNVVTEGILPGDVVVEHGGHGDQVRPIQRLKQHVRRFCRERSW